MKLQAITICVNYSDFLCWSLIENRSQFDRWLIVTDTKDTKTKELCDNYGVECIQTDVFYENGGKFNKYAGINEGLKHLDKDAWILFLDGDIILHHMTKYILEKLNLQKDTVYGVDRVNCIGLNRWIQYMSIRNSIHQNWLLHTSGMPLGARLVHYFGEAKDKGVFMGWRPLGFFQLTHGSAFETYPQNTIGADHCDLEFIRQYYSRDKRSLIPELMAIHLESEGAVKGINWYGRKSLPFSVGVKNSLLNRIKNIFHSLRVRYHYLQSIK